MENSRKAKKRIIFESYIRLVLLGMVIIGATNLCGFIDNIMIGRYLGDEALASVGYFSPVMAITSFIYVITFGALILCGNFIGSGQRKKVNSLFTGTFFCTIAVSLVLVLVLVFFRADISYFLGARNRTAQLLMEYILGYAPEILFANTSAFLLSLTSYNNDIRISYIATAVLLVGNVLADMVLVVPLGIFGIGLASTISSAAVFAILMPGFLKRNKTIHLELTNVDISLVFEDYEYLQGSGKNEFCRCHDLC